MRELSILSALLLAALVSASCSGAGSRPDYGGRVWRRSDGAMDYRDPATKKKFDKLQEEWIKETEEFIRIQERNKEDYLRDK